MEVRFLSQAPFFIMSTEFHQFRFPCKTCIVQACCKEKPEDEVKLYPGHHGLCLAVPELPPNVSYSKGLLECWANLGKKVIDSMTKTEDPKTRKEINNNIPYPYVSLIIHMAGIFVHITHSASWREGELFDFDQFEINRKIKNLHI